MIRKIFRTFFKICMALFTLLIGGCIAFSIYIDFIAQGTDIEILDHPLVGKEFVLDEPVFIVTKKDRSWSKSPISKKYPSARNLDSITVCCITYNKARISKILNKGTKVKVFKVYKFEPHWFDKIFAGGYELMTFKDSQGNIFVNIFFDKTGERLTKNLNNYKENDYKIFKILENYEGTKSFKFDIDSEYRESQFKEIYKVIPRKKIKANGVVENIDRIEFSNLLLYTNGMLDHGDFKEISHQGENIPSN